MTLVETHVIFHFALHFDPTFQPEPSTITTTKHQIDKMVRLLAPIPFHSVAISDISTGTSSRWQESKEEVVEGKGYVRSESIFKQPPR
jgi:hypothetical protein